MPSKEVKQLMKALEKQDFEVEQTRSNHYKVKKGGKLITFLPSTPSDSRSLKNCMPYLKRAGYKP
ncbi:hypothetical protein [Streptomyces noursei]|uniref:hypothetical protein n=1 Tax=Streptomyces noursei TaxID=1971 RepID=UPI00167AC820|nr:hypothetical protein [Streptomyces noursei]MCZ1021420.1 hypothetical protein [Streptomyces noursei]GGX46337.1 hypothetical protein GCM10010341_80070 [Streptomyces noursei]